VTTVPGWSVVEGVEAEGDAPVPPGTVAEGCEVADGLTVADALAVVVGVGVTSTVKLALASVLGVGALVGKAT
jgi:hypothetical protein